MVRNRPVIGPVTDNSTDECQRNEGGHKSSISQMQNSLRKTLNKVTRNTGDEARSPLTKRNFRTLPNIHKSSTPIFVDQGVHSHGPSKTHDARSACLDRVNGKERRLQDQKEDVHILRSSMEQQSNTNGKNADITPVHSFGRHSAARKQLRTRMSMSAMSESPDRRLPPNKSNSIPDLRRRKHFQVPNRPPLHTHPIRDSASICDQVSAAESPTLESTSLQTQENEVTIRADRSTQTDLKDNPTLETQCKTSGLLPDLKSFVLAGDAPSEDFLMTSSLDMGIHEFSDLEGPFHKFTDGSAFGQYGEVDNHELDDLRRILSTSVTWQWLGLSASKKSQLFQIHIAVKEIMQELITEKLRGFDSQKESERTCARSRQVSLQQHKLLGRISSCLYGLPLCNDLKMQPAGMLLLYFAALDYLHQGHASKAGDIAVSLKRENENPKGRKDAGNLAIIGYPDSIFLKVVVPRLYEGSPAQFFPLYLVASPLHLSGGDLETNYSTNASWLTWCKESASFKGTVPSERGNPFRTSTTSPYKGSGHGSFPLVVTVDAVIRFRSDLAEQDTGPILEKHISTQICFDIHRASSSTHKARSLAGLLNSIHPLKTSFNGSYEDTAAEEASLLIDAGNLFSGDILLQRAHRCASLAMRLSTLAKEFSRVAMVVAEPGPCPVALGLRGGKTDTPDSTVPLFSATSGTSNYCHLWTPPSPDSSEAESHPSRLLQTRGSRDRSPISGPQRRSTSLNLQLVNMNGIEKAVASGTRRISSLTQSRVSTPSSSPERPAKAPEALKTLVHAYRHPMNRLSWAVIDRVEVQSTSDDDEIGAETRSAIETHSPKSTLEPNFRKGHQRSTRGRSRKRRCRGKDKSHKLDCSKPIVGACDIHVVTRKQSIEDLGVGSSRKQSGLESDVRLSANEIEQLQAALAASRREEITRRAGKTRELENWDDIFDVVSDMEDFLE